MPPFQNPRPKSLLIKYLGHDVVMLYTPVSWCIKGRKSLPSLLTTSRFHFPDFKEIRYVLTTAEMTLRLFPFLFCVFRGAQKKKKI
jgi:hypothetical protein